jgi:hypothetical protein
MIGSAFVVHDNGWCCSNDVHMDIETDVSDVDGQKIGRQTNTLKLNSIFNGIGTLQNDMKVEAVMLADDKKYGFVGRVRQVEALTVIQITGTINNTQEIIKKIK